METYWGKFCWRPYKVDRFEEKGIESKIFSTAELHWTAGSHRIHSGHKDNWFIFAWGNIRRENKKADSQSLILEMLDSLRNEIPVMEVIRDLQGDFSLIVWDEQNRKLYIATDPFGIAKTYFSIQKDSILVSSHPVNFAKHGVNLEISDHGLTMLFSLKGIMAPYSIFKDIQILRPAELLQFSEDGASRQEYWQILELIERPYTDSYERAAEELVNILTSTLKNDLSNSDDNPAGVFLSSGIDSTFLLGLLQSINIPSVAYTVGYNPTTKRDESFQAIQNAQNMGAQIAAFHPTDRELYHLLDYIVQIMPEPCSDATILPQLHLTNQAYPTEKFFDGTGADNIFGGMRRFRAENLILKYHLIPKPIRKNILAPILQFLPSSRHSELSNWIRLAQKFSYGSELASDMRLIYWLRFLPEGYVKQILIPEYYSNSEFINQHFFDLSEKASFLKNDFRISTYITIKSTLPIYAMQKLQNIQLATGAKVFTPYISNELVPWAIRLPQEFKMNSEKSKIILRDVLSKLIRNNNSSFAKANFSPPLERWLNGVFQEEFRSLIKDQEFFQKDFLNLMIKQQNDRYRDWEWELWLIFLFLKWWEELKNKG